MRVVTFILAVMATSALIQWNVLRGSEGEKSAASQAASSPSVTRHYWTAPPTPTSFVPQARTPVAAKSRPATTFDVPVRHDIGVASQQAFRAPKPGMFVSAWFGANKNRARVIATNPVNGLVTIFTITRTSAMRGSGTWPTFAEVSRFYNAEDGQDVSTLANAAFEFRDGHMHVSNFKLLHPPRIFDPNFTVIDPDDPTNEARAWEYITRFRLEPDGLTAVDFDQMFAGTIAKRYVRLDKP